MVERDWICHPFESPVGSTTFATASLSTLKKYQFFELFTHINIAFLDETFPVKI